MKLELAMLAVGQFKGFGRRRTGAALGLASILLGTIACGGGQEVTITPPTVAAEGVFGANASPGGGRACVWVLRASGDRIGLLLPDDWSVTLDPVVLLNEAREPIAEGGDHVRAAGPAAVGENSCGDEVQFDTVSVERL